jgi:hypothetical protein
MADSTARQSQPLENLLQAIANLLVDSEAGHGQHLPFFFTTAVYL